MSRAIVSPIHTGLVVGKPVRFFRDPSGRPALPWHASADLFIAMGLPRHVRRQLLERTRAFPESQARTVATADGVVVIAPHFMAQGVIGAAVECHGVSDDFERQYIAAGVAALDVLTGNLPKFAAFDFVLVAARNSIGTDGGAS